MFQMVYHKKVCILPNYHVYAFRIIVLLYNNYIRKQQSRLVVVDFVMCQVVFVLTCTSMISTNASL